MTWNPTEPDTLDLAIQDALDEVDEVRKAAIRLLTSKTPHAKLIGIDHIIPHGTKWVVLYRTRASGRLRRVTSRVVIIAPVGDRFIRDGALVVSIAP